MKSCAAASFPVRLFLLIAIPAILLSGIVCLVRSRAADVAAGQKFFVRCRICHTVAADAPNTVGPNLHGLFGRKAGSRGGFAYSSAMKASGVTWNDDTLARYLRDPQGFIPGNRMGFPGIKDDKDVADLLAYLQQATK